MKKLLLGLLLFVPSSILAHEGLHSHQNELMHPFKFEFAPAVLVLAVIMTLGVVSLSIKHK